MATTRPTWRKRAFENCTPNVHYGASDERRRPAADSEQQSVSHYGGMGPSTRQTRRVPTNDYGDSFLKLTGGLFRVAYFTSHLAKPPQCQ